MASNGGITDPQEFWNALGRLYDSILELRQNHREISEDIAELRGAVSELKDATGDLRERAADLLEGTTDLFRVAALHQDELVELSKIVKAHEMRHDYTKIVDVALREELRRLSAQIQAVRDKLDQRS